MKIVVLDGDVINPGDISWAPLEKLGEVVIHGHTPEDMIAARAAGAAHRVLGEEGVQIHQQDGRALPRRQVSVAIVHWPGRTGP